ncbi:MAG: hypothetical protein RHS_4559 [Robinsoniella sp. RHS]|nr:MAG: hypothetical protein RHS_4559 [Robinsoniella sp. RHS]
MTRIRGYFSLSQRVEDEGAVFYNIGMVLNKPKEKGRAF